MVKLRDFFTSVIRNIVHEKSCASRQCVTIYGVVARLVCDCKVRKHMHALDDCIGCIDDPHNMNTCEGSPRLCGHHCRCLYTQDSCCWCSAWVDENGEIQ